MSVVSGMEAIPFFDYRVPECHRPTNYARSRSLLSLARSTLPAPSPHTLTVSQAIDDEEWGDW